MDKYVSLAKQAVEEYIKNHKLLEPPENLPREFYSQKAGVFVTIFNQGNLRGCIGTYLPLQENIAQEIIVNAVSACSSDYRFSLIRPEELSNLNYEVSVLSRPRPIKDINKHNPKIHGIIVKSDGGRSGLLLPDLKGINTTRKQIVIACQKAGIDPDSKKIQLYQFTTEKHGVN